MQEMIKGQSKLNPTLPNKTPLVDPNKRETTNGATCEPTLINKVGDYCEAKENNTTLPIEVNNITSIAILDSGTRVAIAIKEVWESWGKVALRKTKMKLQLTDGFMESPISLLEHIIVTYCKIKYEHTFAIVDFGKKFNHEINLAHL